MPLQSSSKSANQVRHSSRMTSSRMASSKEGSAQKDFSKRGPFYASANTSQTTLDYQFPTDRHQRIRRGDDYRLSSRIQKVAEVNFLDDQVCGPFVSENLPAGIFLTLVPRILTET